MNQVIMTGNLTRDPETKQTQSGKLRATFGLAVQRGNNDTEFFNLVAWEKNAEFIQKYFVKGSRMIIQGYLQTNNYTDASGAKHYGVDIIVDNVEFGGGKKTD